AAFETARPQPHLVTEDLRDPPLPIAIEHEQRPPFGPAHHRKPARDAGIDEPEPASPLRLVATGAGEIGGNRMALSDIGYARLEPEQLADRESDQRQLANGRSVLLLRRSQNGEMNQVDSGIGLEQVTPSPFTRMRLA